MNPEDKQFHDEVAAKVYKAHKADRQAQTKELSSKLDGLKLPETLKVSIEGADIVTIKGERGDQGDIGPEGVQGEKGEKGEDSYVPGPQGEKGDQGLQGPAGESIVGPEGPEGPQGPMGEQGLSGKDGTEATADDIIKMIGGKLEVKDISNIGDFGSSILNEAKALVPRSLAGMYDVDILGVTDGQTLVYNYSTKKWVPGTASSGGSGWLTTGNLGTDPAINYIGTNDEVDFVIRTNTFERLRFLTQSDGTSVVIAFPDASGNNNISALNNTFYDVTGSGQQIGFRSLAGDAALFAFGTLGMQAGDHIRIAAPYTVIDGKPTDGSPQELRFAGDGGFSSNYVGFQAPSNVLNTVNYVWPDDAPAVDGYVLSGTTGGTLSWVAQSGGGGGGTVTSVTSATGDATVATTTTTPVITIVSAPKLTTARNINGVAFDGTANITVTAAAGTLTGTTLNSTVVTSSLTSVGTITTGVWNGTKIGLAYGGTNADLSATGGTSQVLRQSTSGGTITVSQLAASDLSNGTTGSGAVVLAGSPTITTAVLGSSTATTQVPGDNSTKLATTAYVQAAIFATQTIAAVKYATTAALTATYSNGSSGVGATLTEVALGALSVDGVTPSIGDRILVKNQASSFQNGIYTVTTVGSGAAAYVLTRATDYNVSADINLGDNVFVSAGSTLATTTWTQNGTENPVMGTDPITFAQTAGTGTYTSGNGLTLTGTSFAINTSVTVDKNTAQALTNKDLTSGTNTFPTFNQNTTGSAAKWTTGRTLSITGDIAYTSPSFDGSGNVTAAGTLAIVNGNVGSFTYASITVNAKGLITAASNGATPEVPLTFSTGLTRSTNTITVNTSQNISTLSNLTSNGLIKTSGSTGALSIATAGTDYQVPITLTTTGTSGVATFSAGTLNIPNYTYTLPTASTSVLGGVKVDGTSITITGGVISSTGGSTYTGTTNRITVTGTVIDISASYVGQSSITTLGTVTTGTLSTGAIIGGVTMTLGSDANYDIYYRNSSGVLTRLANGSTGNFLGANTGAAPSWQTPPGSGGITIGTTTITSGTSTRMLYDNAGVVGETSQIVIGTDHPTILDSGGINLLDFVKTASAVNYLTITNSATATMPTLGVAGTDAAIGLRLATKGATNVQIYNVGGGTPTLEFFNTFGGFVQGTINGSGWGGGVSQGMSITPYTENFTFSEYTASGNYSVIVSDTMKTQLNGSLRFPSQSPTSLSSSQNNYALPTVRSAFIRLTASTPVNITGIVATVDGEVHMLWNIGTSTITLQNQNASSTSANRFLTSTGSDIALAANQVAMIQYDTTTAFWRATLLVPGTGGGSSFTWTNVTGTTQSAAVNSGYIPNNAGLVTVTLPTTAAIGDIVRISGQGAGGWRVAQNASQVIVWDTIAANVGVNLTTSGVTGHIDSTDSQDSVELQCVVATTGWKVVSNKGDISLT